MSLPEALWFPDERLLFEENIPAAEVLGLIGPESAKPGDTAKHQQKQIIIVILLCVGCKRTPSKIPV